MQRTVRALSVFSLVLVFAANLGAQFAAKPRPGNVGKPAELHMTRARSVKLDLRKLPFIPPAKRQRFEREAPPVTPVMIDAGATTMPRQSETLVPVTNAIAPAPTASFDGLDFNSWGAGHPPDTNGDVGPQYYIQTINTSIGIYDKTTHARVAAFTFDTFMSQGNFGNLCDTDNFGDPVVLYDSFEDRWIITDFAFRLDGSSNVINPPGNFQCLAVSMTGDPVSGGWNYYSINTTGGLGDYPKLGVWPDGVYMSVNMFDYPSWGGFQNVRLYAFNKAQMYAGAPSVQVVSFDAPATEFTILPSNARLQTGTPPAGSPNYFSVVWNYLNAISVYEFHVDWDHISLSSLTGPFTSITGSNWAVPPGTVSTQGGGSLDTLAVRLMVQNQYSNLGSTESLWNVHTVQGASASLAAPRYYQLNVTGGTVAASTTQAANYDPADGLSRFMGSVAVNRLGDMALGYSVTSSTMYPAIRYAGRLAGDAVNTITLTDRSLIDGTGTQTTYTRWGDYSAMTLDPDGCTFWYTTEYYAATGLNYLTRIGSFIYPACSPVSGTGTLQGTVTVSGGGSPISGATVQLGARTTTTNGSGVYSFATLPPGTYPTLTVFAAGYNGASASNIAVTAGGTTTQNFALTASSASTCVIDTSQTDFQAGVPTNVDLTTAPGSVTLVNSSGIDQQNTSLGNFGPMINSTTWGGQTFTPSASGSLTRADINLFCASCTGTTPNLTLSLRATSGGLPTGGDLASGTIAGFSSGAAAYYTVNFSPSPVLTAGTMYALVVRPVSNPSAGTYALTRSGAQTIGADIYAGGSRVTSGNSGATWSVPTTGGVTSDAGFKIYIYADALSGNLVSSTKDSNPASGLTPTWGTISWTATVPANTSLQFQAAASNSALGPFTFVGPDGTSGTFFTSGASLVQFNGFRYLKYKAILSTTNRPATPALNDVTICFSNTAAGVPVAPTGVLATATTATSVSVSWNPVGGATSYVVLRKAALVGSYAPLPGTPVAPPYVDTTAVANTAYLYVVHAVNSGGESGDSLPDLATTVPFTDDPLVGGTTFVLATHLDQIRTAVNAVHVLAGLGALSFTDGTLPNIAIKAVHITELRTALNASLTALSLPTISFTDPVVTGAVTPVKSVHFQQLRDGVK